MSSLWTRVEPLLARVQKPARYIGCEDGVTTPRHDKLPNGGTVAWLLAYPDTYEIGLPNQGLQILYEILNERDDAVAERTYAPWFDLTEQLRSAGVPLFSVDTHRPAVGIRHPRVQPVERARVHERGRDDRPGGNPAPHHRAWPRRPDRHRRRSCSVQPRAAGRLHRRRRARRGRRGRVRDHRARPRLEARRPHRPRGLPPRAVEDPRGLRARRCTRSVTTAIASSRSPHASPTCPQPSTSARSPTWANGRTQSPSCRSPRSSTIGSASRSSAGAPVVVGSARPGMITRPVRERPAEQVRTMIRDGLRRTGYDEVSLTSLSTADFSDIEPVVTRRAGRPKRSPVVRRHPHDQPAVVAGRRVHRRSRR